MNKVILIGNLVRDVELSMTQSGVSMAKFSIAVNRKFANVNGDRETDFFNIVAWRGLADNCAKFLCKGKKVSVVGNLQNRNYEDNKGNKKQLTEIVAEEIEFLSPVDKSVQQQQEPQYPGLQPVDDDDLPF